MDDGPVLRREGFLPARAVAALLRDPSGADTTQLRDAIPARWSPEGEIQLGRLELGPGEGLCPVLPPRAKAGLILDLDPPGWRSEWGGLLLFQGGEGRLSGYRPVPGALTVFAAETAPLISLVMLRAPPRNSLLGWWA